MIQGLWQYNILRSIVSWKRWGGWNGDTAFSLHNSDNFTKQKSHISHSLNSLWEICTSLKWNKICKQNCHIYATQRTYLYSKYYRYGQFAQFYWVDAIFLSSLWSYVFLKIQIRGWSWWNRAYFLQRSYRARQTKIQKLGHKFFWLSGAAVSTVALDSVIWQLFFTQMGPRNSFQEYYRFYTRFGWYIIKNKKIRIHR